MRIGIAIDAVDARPGANDPTHCAIFLARAFARLPQVGSVVVFIATADVPRGVPPDGAIAGFDCLPRQDVGDQVDVIIDVGGVCEAAWLALQQARGKKAVLYVVDPPYAARIETAIFDRPSTVRPPARFDETWLPSAFAAFVQVERVLGRCPVHVVPYLWDASFAAERAGLLKTSDRPFGWRPIARAQGWRIAVFETNTSVANACNIPLLVCDQAARACPGSVQHVNVLNTLHVMQHPTLMFLANSLDIVRQHRAVFLGAYHLVDFMAELGDAVVSHQWMNEQSSSHLEALWGNYALVHNAQLCADLGLFYPGNDVREGARRVLEAIDEHDADADGYRARQRGLIARYLPGDLAVTSAYCALLDALVQRSPR